VAEQTQSRIKDPGRRVVPDKDQPSEARVRDEDLEPHAGLRYIARLFKALAILLILMLIAEIVIGLSQDGTNAIGTLLVQATRMIVFAAALWASGDLALMFIESNHDLRATRILLGRINSKLGAEADGRLGNPPSGVPPQLP
jgi:hypothetical protein